MNVSALSPQPTGSESFRRSRERFVPQTHGCYVLTTFLGDILYIGLSNNLRRRINEHLDSEKKTALTKDGRAVLFHWLETTETNKVERTWLNIHLIREGELPVLNSIYSPTSS
jgi:excinuclease UvrABC nuclease subunit